MKPIYILLVAVLTCGPAFSGELEEVEAKFIESWDALDSLSCLATVELLMNVDGMTLPGRGRGQFDYMREDGRNLSRLDLRGSVTVPLGEQAADIPQELVAVFDGGLFRMLTVVLLNPVVMEYDASEEPEVGASPAQLLLETLHKEGHVQLLPDDEVGAVPVHVIEAVLPEIPDDAVVPMKRLRLYIGKESGLLVRARALSESGATVGLLGFRDVKTNPGFEKSRFELNAPKEARRIDFEQAGEVLLPTL